MPEGTTTPLDVFEKVRKHERAEQLAAAKEQDVLPYFRLLESQAGPVVEMEGRETVMLGSNNYLGLTADKRVQQAARDALERYGTGVTGSRLLNGTTPLHVELERELAEWMQTEDTIVFTTGYQSNLGAISALLAPGDTIICDSGDHASILDGCKLSGARLRPFRHNRTDKLESMLSRAAEDESPTMVVVDGVFSMEGDVCDLPPIVELCQSYGARLMVDEAHGVGVLGERGAGACELFGLEDQVDLRMGTFSKSLASCGGFIAGSEEVIEYLRISSRSFIFSASAVPAATGAALGALRVIRSDGPELFARLLDNARYLRRGFRELGLSVVEPGKLQDGTETTTPVVPVIVGEDWQAVLLWSALFEAGVYTNVALHPAVPPGGALLRTSLMATHEKEHLDRALEIFSEVIERFPELPRT
ncbi:MAG: aminotransferase class I/II-fold pyridoxal phosphate-dependent enzyme [Solirubrobacterales bacterium]|nr:aminotransferase class I/II-fold pyridoxal phosphate-dependent enzyme [Solirubrobacterales bacterium]